MMKAKNAIYEFTQIRPRSSFFFKLRFINSRRVWGLLFYPPSSHASSIFVRNNIIIGNSRRVPVEAVDIFIRVAGRRNSLAIKSETLKLIAGSQEAFEWKANIIHSICQNKCK